jgi:type IV pilus assembly protein PilQ
MSSHQENPTMSQWRAAVAALSAAGALLLAPAAWAQNAIQSITSSQQAGTEVVRIEMSEPLAGVPNGFSVQSPPRIAIDLPGVDNALGRNTVEVNQGNLRSVAVATAGDRTRLVLNLKQASGYRAQVQGKALLLILDVSGPALGRSRPAGAVCAGAERHFASAARRGLPPRA